MESKVKKLPILGILFMTLMIHPGFLSGASRPGRISFGVYGGWSQGLGYDFGWHSRPSRSDDYNLDIHLGAYVQYNLSAILGIQTNVNYQHGTNPWTFTYPGWPYDAGTDKFRIVSVNLNGVVTPLRLKWMSFYFLGGGGITSGKWEDFSGTYFNLTGGLGARIYISQSHPNLALNLGGAFVYLIDPEEFGGDTANYLRFLIGIEF
jgi:hypothetical protein